MKITRYQEIQFMLKEKIQQGIYEIGDYLPSENELCKTYSITRTTVRKALDELIKEGFIEKQQGKGSRVKERRKSLGLLNVKGFSEAVGQNVKTIFLQNPKIENWKLNLFFNIEKEELKEDCIYFERLRCVGGNPVMLEKNWFSSQSIPDFTSTKFIDGSFFKTLSQKYLIEITGSDQELRAESADEKTANLLIIETGSPVLHISVKFFTSKPNLHIYSELYCNTSRFPVGNSYHL